ncbi:hypothetical protein CYLTODRAFT_492264 [Cylindrobasidium torrendii FP15055 ss-10]|uniref:DUF6534 domain-containing protein n=1 Tax=Cylindrobasidium torrendii FP15055 ss-10 TaxID=1314674 RepID=A0A0D7B4T1_9AGAR|nr:hypothetical protein CYLTODRAFT_492264 [Cylindrobasidium torrendii FP15055 ss-10]
MGFLETTVHNTMGLLFDATIIGAALYGVGCMQAWNYYRKFAHRDTWQIKAAVTLVILCDTIQMALLSESLYSYLVTHHGDDAYFAYVEKTLIVELFFSGIIGLVVQTFYAYRIWHLSKKWYLVAYVGVLISVAFVLLCIYFELCLHFDTMAELGTPKATALSISVNGFTAACDISITVIMIVFLERSKTGFKKSTDMVNRLILFVFNTGMPTTICAILGLALIKGEPTTYLYIFFYLLMGRFYTNSLLIILNSRDYIRNASSNAHSSSNNGYSLQSMPAHILNRSSRDPQEISIHIDTTTSRVEDSDISRRKDDKSAVMV